jgi:hypothetical protein
MLRVHLIVSAWAAMRSTVRSRVLCALPAVVGGISAVVMPAYAEPSGAPAPQWNTQRPAGAARSVDLDASADYYRGYRDAMRDAARLTRSNVPYRQRTYANSARTWPQAGADGADRLHGSWTGRRRGSPTGQTAQHSALPQPAGTHELQAPWRGGRQAEHLPVSPPPAALRPTQERAPDGRQRFAPHPLPMPQSPAPPLTSPAYPPQS